MSNFEKIQIVTNVIAIILSIISLIYTYIISKKQAKLKMKENYYQPVFQDMLLIELPKAFTDFINIKKEVIYPESSNNFEKIIGEFRKKIKFLQFTDINVYNNIDDLLIKIDENIVLLCCNKENQGKKIKETHELVSTLYTEINNYYK